MPTSVAAFLKSYYFENYATLTIITAVVYDYVLTFSTEVEHIWNRKWTWVSTTFLLVRYMGLLSIITVALNETGFVPGPLWVRIPVHCKTVTYLMRWSTILFTIAADLVMIFRIYALYNKSRAILCALLFIYVAEVVVGITSGVMYSTPHSTLVKISPAPYPSICVLHYRSIDWGQYSLVPLVVLEGTMCLLAIYHSAAQAYQDYAATRGWQFNKYVKLIVHQGVFYFVINFLYTIVIKHLFTTPMDPMAADVLAITLDVLIYTLNPRFILSIRELYACTLDVQGLDTGFGMAPGQGIGTLASIRFVHAEPDEGMGEGDVSASASTGKAEEVC